MLYPLRFEPLFMERIWGGRMLEIFYGKNLPPGAAFGESWEICDRPEAQSVVANGPLAGWKLNEIAKAHQTDLMGSCPLENGRFPLLVKILDARKTLSLQVHPPAEKAVALGGEPKTEMWYVTHAEPGAELYVGLKKGTTQAEFEKKNRDGSVAQTIHHVTVEAGDAMFLPSGRVHAIGAGLVLFEIQQNSDTTYRVFDWNRVDASGKSRTLHIKESLSCINFNDFEPVPILKEQTTDAPFESRIRSLVHDPVFSVQEISLQGEVKLNHPLKWPMVVGVVSGQLAIEHPSEPVELKPGQFCLVPACLSHAQIRAISPCCFLTAHSGVSQFHIP